MAVALLTDAFLFAGRNPAAPVVRVLATDTELELSLGEPGAEAAEVRAPLRELLPWALGRQGVPAAGAGWPRLPAWL